MVLHFNQMLLTVETEPADKFAINCGDIFNTLFDLEMIYDIPVNCNWVATWWQ
jgi:hypothetical protein